MLMKSKLYVVAPNASVINVNNKIMNELKKICALYFTFIWMLLLIKWSFPVLDISARKHYTIRLSVSGAFIMFVTNISYGLSFISL